MKKLIVTGATGGIGSEIARLASANDYKVGLIDTDEEKLTSLSKQINNSVPLLADVTSEDDEDSGRKLALRLREEKLI